LAPALLLAGSLVGVSWVQEPAKHSPPTGERLGRADVHQFVTQYCTSCHHGDEKAGGLDLDAASSEDVAAHTAVWEKVARKLAARQMPPAGRKRPEERAYAFQQLGRAAHDIASHGEGRRAVVVITDGIDTASKESPDAIIARSRALDVPVYTVTVVSPIDDPTSDRYVGKDQMPAAAVGGKLLQRYAEMSGGSAFLISDFPSLRRAAERIALELKHQYRLGYDPPEGPRRFRRVEVRTTRKGVSVRTRSGYLPPS
jgi:VWFA-related protein